MCLLILYAKRAKCAYPLTQEQLKNMSHTDPEKEETLAQRSARLEAEAAELAQKDAYIDINNDPLAPEPLDDEPENEHDDNVDASLLGGQAEGIIKALQDEVDKAKDQTARALAEAENTRRRAIKEREDASKFAISGFAKDILDVSDNLRRALEAVPEDLLETEQQLKTASEEKKKELQKEIDNQKKELDAKREEMEVSQKELQDKLAKVEAEKNAAEQEVAKRKTKLGAVKSFIGKGGSKKRKYSFKKLPKRKRRNNKSNKTQAKKRGKRLNRSKKMRR